MTGVCSTARLASVTALGAEAVVDYTLEDFVERAGTYDVVIDILGKTSFARGRRILALRGRMVYVSFKMTQILQMLWTSVFSDQKVICALVTERQDDLVTIRTLVEAGTLRSVVDRTFALEQAAEAHRYAESDAKTGAVVISLQASGASCARSHLTKRVRHLIRPRLDVGPRAIVTIAAGRHRG